MVGGRKYTRNGTNMTTITTVSLRTIPVGKTFMCPWKPEGRNVGMVLRQGVGSVGVHAPNQWANGWEHSQWAPETQVVPCSEDLYKKQSFGDGEHTRTLENRSEVESPVKVVHRLYTEMAAAGKSRKEMLEAAIEKGVNPNTAKTQYYHWRKKYLS